MEREIKSSTPFVNAFTSGTFRDGETRRGHRTYCIRNNKIEKLK